MKLSTYIEKKRIVLAAVCFAMAAVCISVFGNALPVYGDTKGEGTINDGPVKVRSAPVDGEKIALLEAGAVVTVTDETKGSDGYVWYQITATNNGTDMKGYVRADFVALAQTGGTSDALSEQDAAYVAALKEGGFPQSYCDLLLELHKKHPQWQFAAVDTGLEWSTAVTQENAAGRNLIQSAVNDARKSTDSAAYDWATNQWYGYDGAGWVCASIDYIAYCMDPRNFLNEKYIFQFETLEYAPYQTKEGVSNILAGTFMEKDYEDTDGVTRNYADTFVTIGGNLWVSPYHLAARCAQEQGKKGTSPLISGKYEGYEGYFNYFNVRAFTTSNASAAANGLAYAKQQGWDSIYKAIAGGSAVVANNYVKKGQNTIYFEKFNVVYKDSLYSHQYMTNVQAAMSEGSNMEKAYKDKDQAFVFRIPVYKNMPKDPVPFKDRGNPNNWLSAITVDGYSLTPVFSGAKTTYSLVVDESVSSITVKAAPVAKTSTVSGMGSYNLNYGNNTIEIKCKSQSGQTRTYTLTVARQQGAGVTTGGAIAVTDSASITSMYPIGTYVTGIEPGSSVSTVLSGIQAQGCTVKVLNALGMENTGDIGTGNRLAVYVDEKLVKEYEIVIYGDINGDGKVSNVDFVLMQKQILGIATQSGSYLEAANTSKDGGVSNKDSVVIQKHILGISKISQ